MGSSLRQPNLLHAQSDSGPDRPGVGSNRPQSVVQHELEVGVAIEVGLALAAKPFSDGQGAFIALIDQQGRHGEVGVLLEVIEEQADRDDGARCAGKTL